MSSNISHRLNIKERPRTSIDILPNCLSIITCFYSVFYSPKLHYGWMHLFFLENCDNFYSPSTQFSSVAPMAPFVPQWTNMEVSELSVEINLWPVEQRNGPVRCVTIEQNIRYTFIKLIIYMENYARLIGGKRVHFSCNTSANYKQRARDAFFMGIANK